VVTRSVSVIIPAFNVADSLARCIESVLAQCLAAPRELIVIDNGSRDGPNDVVARSATADAAS
jgi:glycosyltransferase involved in cell wall biosynthesis